MVPFYSIQVLAKRAELTIDQDDKMGLIRRYLDVSVVFNDTILLDQLLMKFFYLFEPDWPLLGGVRLHLFLGRY